MTFRDAPFLPDTNLFWSEVPEIIQYAAAPSYLVAPVFKKVFAEIKAPTPIAAPWLGVVQRRLETSIQTPDDPKDPSAISDATAASAIAFFEATSDLLPAEPFLYPTALGDVVAEFIAQHGSITGVLSSDNVFLHAVVDGDTLQREIRFDQDSNSIREQLRNIALKLNNEKHGTTLDSSP